MRSSPTRRATTTRRSFASSNAKIPVICGVHAFDACTPHVRSGRSDHLARVEDGVRVEGGLQPPLQSEAVRAQLVGEPLPLERAHTADRSPARTRTATAFAWSAHLDHDLLEHAATVSLARRDEQAERPTSAFARQVDPGGQAAERAPETLVSSVSGEPPAPWPGRPRGRRRRAGGPGRRLSRYRLGSRPDRPRQRQSRRPPQFQDRLIICWTGPRSVPGGRRGRWGTAGSPLCAYR